MHTSMSKKQSKTAQEEMGRTWYGLPVSGKFVHDRPFGCGDAAFHFFCCPSPIATGKGCERAPTSGASCILYAPGASQFFAPLSRDAKDATVCDHVAFSAVKSSRLSRYGIPVNEWIPIDRPDRIRRHILDIYEEERSGLDLAATAIRHLKQLLLISLSREIGRHEQVASLLGEEVVELFRSLCATVEQNPRRNWSVKELAARTGLSRTRFWTYFKEVIGISPQDFIINVRLREVCVLLTNTKLTIKEIADRTGFSNPYYLSRLFRKRLGCPPSQYAERFRVPKHLRK